MLGAEESHNADTVSFGPLFLKRVCCLLCRLTFADTSSSIGVPLADWLVTQQFHQLLHSMGQEAFLQLPNPGLHLFLHMRRRRAFLMDRTRDNRMTPDQGYKGMWKTFTPQLLHCLHCCGRCIGTCIVMEHKDCFCQHSCCLDENCRFSFSLSIAQ